MSLSSNLTRSPGNCINHRRRHSALGVGLLDFCLVRFCFTQHITSYQSHLQLKMLDSYLSLVVYLIPNHQPMGKSLPSYSILSNQLNLPYFLPIFLSFCFLFFFPYTHKFLLPAYYVPILLKALQLGRCRNKLLEFSMMNCMIMHTVHSMVPIHKHS